MTNFRTLCITIIVIAVIGTFLYLVYEKSQAEKMLREQLVQQLNKQNLVVTKEQLS